MKRPNFSLGETRSDSSIPFVALSIATGENPTINLIPNPLSILGKILHCIPTSFEPRSARAISFLPLLAFLFLSLPGWGQSVGEFRSRQSGDWNDPNTWEQWDGSAWVTQYQTGATPVTPAVEGTETGVQNASNTTSHPITLPSGITAGELLLVVFSVDGSPTVNINTGVSGNNWTKLGQDNNGSSVTGAIFWKIAEGGDALTLTTTNSQRSSHITYRISGAVSVSGSSDDDNDSNSNPPNHTPPGGAWDYLWIATRSGDGTTVATAAPSLFSDLLTISGGHGEGASTNTAIRSLNAASLNPGSFTSSSEQWVSYTLAVRGADNPVFSPISFPQTIFPTVAGTNTSAQTGNVSTHNVALPSGIQPGDLLLIFWTDRDNSSNITTTGWTQLYNNLVGNRRRSAYYRIADGTEGATAVFTTSNNERSAHNSYRIAAGTYVGLPVAATPATGTNSNPNPPNLDPGWGTKSALWIAASHSEGNSSGTAPASYTNLITGYTGSTGSSHARMMTARRELAAASEDPGTFSLGNNRNWAANTVAIRGAGSATVRNGHIVTAAANVSVPDVTIDAGGTVIVNDGITFTTPTGGTFNVNGALQMASASALMAGAGTFSLNSGGTLGITSPQGITTAACGTGASCGNIRTAARSFSTGADYIYNGSADQATGSGLPATVAGLTADNSGGVVTLTNSVAVAGQLVLHSILATGANTVTVNNGASASRTNGHVNGNLRMNWPNAASGIFRLFHVGDADYYTPVNIFIISGTGTGGAAGVTVATFTPDHPSIGSSTLDASQSVNRYWRFTPDGFTGTPDYNATFNWDAADEDAMFDYTMAVVGKFNSGTWSYPTMGASTPTSAQIIGESGFSDFQVSSAAPACAEPDVPAISASATTICDGESITISASGNLGDAADWEWYSGSCGGTPVGTGPSIMVSPASNTTYYVRGEGNCVTPGVCASQLITVAQSPELTLTTSSSDPDAVCGEEISFDVEVSNSFDNIAGLQFSVNWDENLLEYVSHTAPAIGGDPAFVGTGNVAGGELTYSWASGAGQDLSDGSVILTLNMKVLTSAGSASVSVSGSPLGLEVVNDDLCLGAVNAVDDTGIELMPLTCAIDGPDEVCPNSTGHVFEAPEGMSSYSWSVTGDAMIDGADDEQTVTIDAGAAGTFTLELTFTNPGGCSAECLIEVGVVDNTPPTPDVADLPDATGECSVTLTPPTATDDCAGAVTGTTTDPTTFTEQGTYTVTWTYDDDNGNNSEQTQTVIVDDNTDPVMNNLPDPMVTLDCESAAYTAPASIWDDSAPPASAENDGQSIEIGVKFLSAIDGAISAVRFYKSWASAENVTVNLYNSSGTLLGSGNASLGAATGWQEVDLSSPVAILANTTYIASVFVASGSYSFTGNYFTFIPDATPLRALQDGEDGPNGVYQYGGGFPTNTFNSSNYWVDAVFLGPAVAPVVSASDNCDPDPTVNFEEEIIPGACAGAYTIERTWTATDASGNSTGFTQTITVQDTEAPALVCPADMTVDNDPGLCSAVVSFAATASDNCGTAEISYSQDPDTPFPVGITTVTVTATDDCNNSASCDFNITVVDAELAQVDCGAVPVQFAFTDADGTGDCSSEIPDVTAAVRAAASDNCDDPADLIVTQTPVAGTDFTGLHGDQTTVEVTVTDDAGNSTICSVTVQLVDNENPVILDCPVGQTFIPLSGTCQVLASWTPPTASDNCTLALFSYTVKTEGGADIPVVDLGFAVFGTFPTEVNTVTYTAVDAAGNSSLCIFTITVLDTEAPTFTGCPPSVTVQPLAGECGAIAGWNPPTATDNCTGLSVTGSHSPGQFFDVGTTTVAYTATDASGNSVVCSFDVTVEDIEAPEISCLVPSVVADPAGGGGFQIPDLVSAAFVSVSDNCPGTDLSDVSQSPTPGTPITADTPVTLTVTDASGNSASCTIQVLLVEPCVVSAGGTNVSCFGGDDGTVTATASGGDAPYFYDWENAADPGVSIGGTETITGLSAGTYNVTIEDSNGCQATGSVTITEPDELTLATGFTAPSCNGENDGTATVTPSGGTTPYSYQWGADTGNQTNATAIALTAGTYDVTVTDANGCTVVASVTVIDPAPLGVTVATTDVPCNGANDGSATASVTGGTAPYSYNWSGGTPNMTGETVSGLAPGSYGLTVTDANGCVATTSFSISQPTVLTATASHTDVSCNGGNDGAITVSATGGTTPYSYSAGAGTVNDNVISDLGPGLYTVTVTDANSCTTTVQVEIGEPDEALTATSSSTPASCNGVADGTAAVSPSGGTAPYAIDWSNGQQGASAVALAAGDYGFTITDDNGCTFTGSVTVTEPDAITADISSTNVSCNGADDGTASVSNVEGGTGDYDYAWSTGAMGVTSISGLSAGAYTVTIADENGCELVLGVQITEPSPVLAVVSDQSNVLCNGDATGSATITASGGAGPYTFEWNDDEEGETRNDLSAGTYNVTVTDANGCSTVVSVTIDQPTVLIANAAPIDVSCNGDSNGEIAIFATGGTTPYSYSAGAGTVTDNVIGGLSPGVYNVTVTDDNGCTTTIEVEIDEPAEPLTATTNSTPASCNGAADGTATVSPSGGTSPYTIDWANGQQGASAIALAAGDYDYTVTDENGCTFTGSVTVTEPDAITAEISKTDVGCNGAADGTASVSNEAGGTGDYDYAWSTGAMDVTSVSGLSAGAYTVTITDENGCELVLGFQITEPSPLTAVVSDQTDVACNGENSGSATITANGGTGDYSFDWSDDGEGATRNDLGVGTYTVTVTDDNGCSTVVSVTIGQATTLVATATHTDVTCNGADDGAITVFATGGNPPYSYDAGAGTVDGNVISELPPGPYTVTVTDGNGCTAIVEVEIDEPGEPLTATSSATPASCFGEADGTATVSPSGGVAPYTVNWSNGQQGLTAIALEAGDYDYTVTDDNGCTFTGSVTVTEPDELIVSAMADMDESCPGAGDGQATVTASGGAPDYSYQWNLAAGGQTTATATNLGAGIYSVTVTDENGCSKVVEVQVGLSDEEAPLIDGCPDDITVFTTGPTCDEPASFTIPAVSDNCGVVSYTLTYANGDPAPATVPLGGLATAGANISNVFAEGQTIVTLTASDAAGNTGVCTFNILVIDNQPPTALCQDITVKLDEEGNASITGEDIDDGSFDNCGVESLVADPDAFTCEDVGENTVTLIVTDIHGNTSTCTATVTVEDNVPPVALCMDITVELNAGGNAVISGSSVDDGSNDACGIESLSVSQTAFNCSHVGENEVTLTVTDVNGNTATCTSTVTIVDNIAPIAICQNATVQLDENGAVTVVPDDVDGGSADACGIATRVVIPNTFGCTDVGANTVTLILTDVNGNSSSCTATVTVQDNVPPTALCQDITVELDETGNGSITAGQIDDGSNDACGIAFTTLSQEAFDCDDVGANTVILTVTDVNGNSSACEATVTVEDNIAPDAVCEDITIQLDADGQAAIAASDIDGGSDDACGISSLSASQNVFGCEDVGVNPVILTVTDVNGNTASCTAIVTVEDNLSPVANCEDITVALDANGNATVSGEQVGGNSTDACGIASLSLSPNTFDCEDIGPNAVLLTVTDENGNTATCTATVTIIDATLPTAICQDITVDLDADGLAFITAEQVNDGSSDNCDDLLGLSIDRTDFDCTDVGPNNVTLTVTDDSGNSSSCTAVVTVVDPVSPEALCQDASVELEENGIVVLTADKINFGSYDNCGIASVTVGPDVFDCSDIGGNTVTLTVTDLSGNTAICTATVTVEDNFGPDVHCMDATVALNPQGTYTILDVDVFDYANSSDNCGDIRVVQIMPSVVTCANLGNTIPVTVLVSDDQGNMSNCSANVTVQEGDLLPTGWAHDDVGDANGDAGFAPCSGLFTVTSQGSITSLTADRLHLVYQQLCGDAEIIVRVETVSNNSWAGVSMRETLDPGSKKVDLKTQLSTFLRRDIRTVTNGTASSQIIPRPQVHRWLRLVRSGNTITGYSSITGPDNWQFTFAANVPMTECIYVGFFAESINSSVATATFSNVMITGNMIPLAGDDTGDGVAPQERQLLPLTSDMPEIAVYPNPANTEAYIGLEAFRGKAAAIELFNDKGQLLYLWEIDEAQPTERLDIGRFPSGLYVIRVKAEGYAPATRRLIKQQN